MSTQQQKSPAQPTQVTPERIRARAYGIYKARNGAPGDPLSDWLQAERELTGSGTDRNASGRTESRAQTRGERLLASGN